MAATSRQQADQRISRLSLWFGALAGPIAWAVRLTVAYVLVPPACDWGTTLFINAVTVATATVAIAAGVISWRNWQRTRRDPRARGPGDRCHFMALYGLLSTIFFLFLIVAEGSMALFINPCLNIDGPFL